MHNWSHYGLKCGCQSVYNGTTLTACNSAWLAAAIINEWNSKAQDQDDEKEGGCSNQPKAKTTTPQPRFFDNNGRRPHSTKGAKERKSKHLHHHTISKIMLSALSSSLSPTTNSNSGKRRPTIHSNMSTTMTKTKTKTPSHGDEKRSSPLTTTTVATSTCSTVSLDDDDDDDDDRSASSVSDEGEEESQHHQQPQQRQRQLGKLQNQLEEMQIEKRRMELERSERIQTLEQENEDLKEELETLQKQCAERAEKDAREHKFELEQSQLIIELREELRSLREVLRVKNHIQRRQNQLGLYQTEEEQGEEHADSGDCDGHKTRKNPNNSNATGISAQSSPGRQPKSTNDGDNDNDDDDDDPSWKQQYLQLHSKYLQLQNDRAYGEWKLRNRITDDVLKYHRRLIHYKIQNDTIENELKTQHTKELQQQKMKLKTSASSMLQHTLQDLNQSQKRIEELENQLLLQQQQQQQNSSSSFSALSSTSQKHHPRRRSSLLLSSSSSSNPNNRSRTTKVSLMEYYRSKNILPVMKPPTSK